MIRAKENFQIIQYYDDQQLADDSRMQVQIYPCACGGRTSIFQRIGTEPGTDEIFVSHFIQCYHCNALIGSDHSMRHLVESYNADIERTPEATIKILATQQNCKEHMRRFLGILGYGKSEE